MLGCEGEGVDDIQGVFVGGADQSESVESAPDERVVEFAAIAAWHLAQLATLQRGQQAAPVARTAVQCVPPLDAHLGKDAPFVGEKYWKKRLRKRSSSISCSMLWIGGGWSWCCMISGDAALMPILPYGWCRCGLGSCFRNCNGVPPALAAAFWAATMPMVLKVGEPGFTPPPGMVMFICLAMDFTVGVGGAPRGACQWAEQDPPSHGGWS